MIKLFAFVLCTVIVVASALWAVATADFVEFIIAVVCTVLFGLAAAVTYME